MSEILSGEKIYGASASERNTRLLRIKVMRANGLHRGDFHGKSANLYIKVLLQTHDNRSQVIDIARTDTVSNTLDPLWNEDFIFRVDPSKHQLAFEIYHQHKHAKDEFLGMFFVELNINIPYQSSEQSMLTIDNPLLKRSALQYVRGTATIGLCYINPNTSSTRANLSESTNTQQNDPGHEIINHRDKNESASDVALPPGWEERKDAAGHTYYIDHNTRSTTWTRPNGRNAPVPQQQQSQIADRRQIDDIDGNNSRTNRNSSPATALHNETAATSSSTTNISDGLGPLPPGWEMSKSTDNRIFFVDHINKRTTWIDPRTETPSSQPCDLNGKRPLPERWEVRKLPDGRVYYIDHLNKTTSWTDPHFAGPAIDLTPVDNKAFTSTICQQRQAAIDNMSYRQAIDQWKPKSFEQLVDSIKRLSANQSEIDQAWIIFYWISQNIRYDTEAYFGNNIGSQGSTNVFLNRKAVCDGYSTLYVDLCTRIGLQCRKVSGYAKGFDFNPRQTSFEKTDHAWNILWLKNGHAYFIESTWGSGYVDDSTHQYKQKLVPHYFLCRPEHMIYNHLPEDPQWQLLQDPLTVKQYLMLPDIYPQFFELNLNIVSPVHTYRIALETGKSYGEVLIASPVNDVELSGSLKDESNKTIEGGDFVDFDHDRRLWRCRFAPQKVGNHNILIFGREKGDMKNSTSSCIVKFIFDIGHLPATPIHFLSTYKSFHEAKCQLFEPFDEMLKRGSKIRFHCRIPGAHEVDITVDGQWLKDDTALFMNENDVYQREIQVGQKEVAVWVKFDRRESSYTALLKYSVK